jgi:hypothetical protein
MTRSPRIGRTPAEQPAQLRGVIAERIVWSSPADPFLTMKAAATYASLSERTLRTACTEPDPAKRLASYKVAGAYLVRRSELDAWIVAHRVPAPPSTRSSGI